VSADNTIVFADEIVFDYLHADSQSLMVRLSTHANPLRLSPLQFAESTPDVGELIGPSLASLWRPSSAWLNELSAFQLLGANPACP
jgi:hypothetical protein